MVETVATFKVDFFTEEENKLVELRKSTNIEDQLTLLLMECHPDEQDMAGLWCDLAKSKARLIMERFNVTAKVTDGTDITEYQDNQR